MLIDTHCHLHVPAYDADRDAVIARMREQGIRAITVGTNARSSSDAVALAEREDGIYATVGFHPSHLTGGEDEYENDDKTPYTIDRLRELAMSSKRVVAIGEAGIDDTYITESDAEAASTLKQAQRDLFSDHILVASELNLPLVIHTRGAFREIADILTREAQAGFRCRGVVHCFTGSWEDASLMLDLGLMLSFTGIVTFKPKKTEDPAKSVLRVIERMPLDRMMLETDAPWLAPEPHRGSRNEPSFVGEIAKTIAVLRGISAEEIEKQTTENAVSFFNLPSH